MELTLIGGLLTTIAGGIAVVIGALAAYQKATASRSEERNLLTVCWDTFEQNGLLYLLPRRARRRIAAIVGADGRSDDDQPEGTDDAEPTVDA